MTSSRRAFGGLLAASLVLLALRWHAAQSLGFGDAEALYASYARHPQAVYVDHPGLVGVLARVLGGGDVPTPAMSHQVTAVAATAAPWVVAAVARAAGASLAGAGLAGLVVLLSPVTSIGLFAMTPDLVLFYAWYGAVGFAVCALSSRPGSTSALFWTLASFFSAGLACDAKVSGALVLAGLVLAFASQQGRPHWRTPAPYAGLLLACVLTWPVLAEEVDRGFPMLKHRFLELRTISGPSLRNMVAFAAGQLLYVSPAMLVAAWFVGRDLYEKRGRDAVSCLLFWVTVASTPLVLLCLVSRVAEPHWAVPMYLALPLHLARFSEDVSEKVGRRLSRAALIVAGSFTLIAHAWVLLGVAPWLGTRVAQNDIANDLVAWRTALPTVREALRQSTIDAEPQPIVVGPHWIVCAQLHALLPRSVFVGCNSPDGDDFRDWVPPSAWRSASVILYVTDSRLSELDRRMPEDRRVDAIWSVPVIRSGIEVRRITIRRLVRMALARAPVPDSTQELSRNRRRRMHGTHAWKAGAATSQWESLRAPPRGAALLRRQGLTLRCAPAESCVRTA